MIVLQLTPEVVVMLATILRKVGGATKTTARGYVKSLEDKLHTLNIPNCSSCNVFDTDPKIAAIYFNDDSLAKINELATHVKLPNTASQTGKGPHKCKCEWEDIQRRGCACNGI